MHQQKEEIMETSENLSSEEITEIKEKEKENDEIKKGLKNYDQYIQTDLAYNDENIKKNI